VALLLAQQHRCADEKCAHAVDLLETGIEAALQLPYTQGVFGRGFVPQREQQIQVGASRSRGSARNAAVEIGAVQLLRRERPGDTYTGLVDHRPERPLHAAQFTLPRDGAVRPQTARSA